MPQTKLLLLAQQPAQKTIEKPTPNYMLFALEITKRHRYITSFVPRNRQKTSRAKDLQSKKLKQHSSNLLERQARAIHLPKKKANYEENRATNRTTDQILITKYNTYTNAKPSSKNENKLPHPQKKKPKHDKTQRCISLKRKHHKTDIKKQILRLPLASGSEALQCVNDGDLCTIFRFLNEIRPSFELRFCFCLKYSFLFSFCATALAHSSWLGLLQNLFVGGFSYGDKAIFRGFIWALQFDPLGRASQNFRWSITLIMFLFIARKANTRSGEESCLQ